MASGPRFHRDERAQRAQLAAEFPGLETLVVPERREQLGHRRTPARRRTRSDEDVATDRGVHAERAVELLGRDAAEKSKDWHRRQADIGRVLVVVAEQV